MINQIIRKRLSELRFKMSTLGIDYFLIPTADFHNSEYVASYFQTRRFFSGFTGSNGTLIVGLNEAGLWTDGRYFIQAEKELRGTGVDLYRESEEGVPTIQEWLIDRFGGGESVPENKSLPNEESIRKNETVSDHQPVLAFDGRCVSVSLSRIFHKILGRMNVCFLSELDPAEGIWTDRPERPAGPVYVLGDNYAGESAQSKLTRLRRQMRKSGTSLYVDNKLDNLMWLFNLRGSDVECTPVALCFGVITMDRQILFIQEKAVTEEVHAYADSIGLELRPYDTILEFLEQPELYTEAAAAFAAEESLSAAGKEAGSANKPGAENTMLKPGEAAGNCGIYFSPLSLSVSLYEAMCKGRAAAFGSVRRFAPEDAEKRSLAESLALEDAEKRSLAERLALEDVEKRSPVEEFKAVKNETELNNIRSCYREDSAAVCKFLYWIHTHVEDGTIGDLTEMDAERKMDSLRAEISDFKELSFKTISAYGPNAAMMHYSAKEEDCAPLKPEGMLLVDCGGQYLRGTTDVTRTMALGPVTDEMRKHYTLTAVGCLQLMDAFFLYGCSGRNVDILARQPLWRNMMDYKCGTGHGIGYLLSVHEGPHNIRWKFSEGLPEAVLEPGMIVSDEPGVYLEGKYGIRIENILEVVEAGKNADGRFLRFSPLTLVPLDPSLIDPEFLTPRTTDVLNDYHSRVFNEIAPFLNEEEKEWLRGQTQKI